MNLSPSSVTEYQPNGLPHEERPEYSRGLTLDRRVGFRQGSPVVGDPVPIDDVGNLNRYYDHYHRGRASYDIDAGEFLESLFASPLIESVEQASEELQTDIKTIETACQLHGVKPPEGQQTTTQSDDDVLTLPNGEQWPHDALTTPEYTDERVVTFLTAQCGLSIEESAQYLSDRLNVTVNTNDVREVAKDAGVI